MITYVIDELYMQCTCRCGLMKSCYGLRFHDISWNEIAQAYCMIDRMLKQLFTYVWPSLVTVYYVQLPNMYRVCEKCDTKYL